MRATHAADLQTLDLLLFLAHPLRALPVLVVLTARAVEPLASDAVAFSDLLFGTWRNPATFPTASYGFWDGASRKVGAMLIGRDVSQP